MFFLYVTLLGETGVQCQSEGLWLRWEDVDLEAGFLRIVSGRDGHRTKSGKSRWVPMTPALRTAMRDHFAEYRLKTYDGTRSPWLFHHEESRAKVRAGSRRHSFRGPFGEAQELAELPAGFVPSRSVTRL